MTEQPLISPGALLTGCKEAMGIGPRLPVDRREQAFLMNAVAFNIDGPTLAGCRLMAALFPDHFGLLSEAYIEMIATLQDEDKAARS